MSAAASPEVDLVPSDVVGEIVSARDGALALYDEFFSALEAAHRNLVKAQAAVAQATGGSHRGAYLDPHVQELTEFQAVCKVPEDFERLRRTARRLVDLQVWAAIVERTQLEHLMDKTAKDELRQRMAYVPEKVDRRGGKIINQAEIEKACPPVTVENVLATIEGFAERSGEIWQRGVAMAFSALDRRFRSHDGFAIGSRIILDGAFDSWGSWNYHRQQRDTIIDIERVFLVLDGKGPRALYAGIIGIVEEERRRGGLSARQSVHEGEYFRLRVYKNGNAHLWFTRDDLVEKVNRILADHYSLGWGDDRSGDPDAPFSRAMERAPARNFGLFPTPDDLADRVIEEAKLYSDTSLRILEPSAGTGQLSRRAAQYTRYQESQPIGHQVTCVEVQPDLATALRRHHKDVLCRDFLTINASTPFDRIIMNPPFDRGRDMDHVHHALRFLAPGGRLVAITSASARYGSSFKHAAFHVSLERAGAVRWMDLPDGSFREAGTNVNACLLTVQA